MLNVHRDKKHLRPDVCMYFQNRKSGREFEIISILLVNKVKLLCRDSVLDCIICDISDPAHGMRSEIPHGFHR